ncbi:MAG: hypothetical protein B7Z68_02705 [Acidobacteria bacterium 21-70-11]|nr:MAG: hypothetical protein B7Z68_02705 [Acidobacteria bacterium 21-70-11]HQT94595.1 FkbM family methyltransferase [Thermoanaerobaculaceae bacterium]HQU33376.1 FkbM family methyltransferase [Thermoanaerobaculaceae bacterium]
MDDLGFLVRSRSLRLLSDRGSAYRPGVLHRYRWRGHDIAYRPGTSDVSLIHDILLRGGGEYRPPAEVRREAQAVGVVLDIGANIGVSALYLSVVFPSAKIYAFEPVPENFAILRQNTEAVGRITAVMTALGAVDKSGPMYSSNDAANFGGFSLHEAGTDRRASQPVAVRNAQKEMDRLGIPAADVIKIDTEGSEWDILASLSGRFLGSTKLILGELHGRHDFALLHLLSHRFDIGVCKRVESRRSTFCALRRPAPLG